MCSRVRYSERRRERPHSRNFVTVDWYNRLILLLVVNLLLGLISKLNFFVVCMSRKKNIVSIGLGAIHGLRHPLGVWNLLPMDKGG